MSIHANPTTPQFKDNAHKAMGDAQLQQAMAKLRVGFTAARQMAVARMPEFEALRDSPTKFRLIRVHHFFPA